MVRPRRKRRWIPWTIVAIVLVAVCLVIDDPLRDFTTNHASIAENSADPDLRPVVFDRHPDELVEAVRRAARRIKNWQFVGSARLDDTVTVVFERTGRVWPFTDDILIRVEDLGDGCRLTGESQSRTRFGDLGQSPRNLRRFLAELAVVLEDDAADARPASRTRPGPRASDRNRGGAT